MPVTAKLSRKFYETFGDEIANELVEWFNQVDATYRADLRELNELNFTRFDAKLEQRLVESDSRWERRVAELDTKWAHRLAELETKWEHRLAELDTKWERRSADIKSELRGEIAALRADLIKWMFVFWAGTTFTILGAALALLKLS